MKPKTSSPPPSHTVPVLLKAIRVFATIAKGEVDATAKSLAATLRVSPTTCYRILQSFLAEGWLQAGPNGTFNLSYGLVPLLRPLLRHELLIEMVREPLATLAQTTGLTAKLSVRQGDSAVTIFSASSPKATAITSRVGAVFPLAIGSSGATILATLPDGEIARILNGSPADVWHFQKREEVMRRVRESRRNGYCFGSYHPQLHTLSTTLQGRHRDLIGAITLLGFPQDFSNTERPALIRELKFTAGGCTQLLE